MKAWHFLHADMRSDTGREPPWTVGETRKLRGGRIVPCAWGYHGSPTPFDALTYGSGPVICLVELSGSITPHGAPTDKYAARMRTLLAAENIERELRLFAADCAERVLPLFERQYPHDERPREAIAAARAYANANIDPAARVAAGIEAGAAAEAAAEAATRAAAWIAAGAAGAATWAAARAAAGAAGAAAEAATWAAARAAARTAAWIAAGAAGAAAGAAEANWQRDRFNEMRFE